jgi:hypothetical protein
MNFLSRSATIALRVVALPAAALQLAPQRLTLGATRSTCSLNWTLRPVPLNQ